MFAVGLAACDRLANPFSDPLDLEVERVTLAIASADEATLLQRHELARPDNEYCRSDEFQRILKQIQAGQSEAVCGQFKAANPADVERLDDAARLLYQIARLSCENPQLNCQSYGAAVLKANLKADPLWGKAAGTPKILKVIADDHSAVAYVEFSTPNPVVRNLKFERREEQWWLVGGYPEANP